MAERKLSVVITGDAKGAAKAMGQVSSSADGMQSKLQSVGAGVGKVFKAAALGAGVLAVGVGGFLKGGVDALIELERLGAQTEAVIKSTGGAAGVTAEQVSKYADSIEKATGIEAEGIISGQNMLLTFTNLKNGVGAGNDIFNQATDIMADMSVAMGTDASKTAVQLGKALNDPIKGISALSKVGVTFTDQQKAQIKAMVEAGDVAGAQKVILAELNKEFGGSAEAFGDTTAGKVQKLKNLFGDMQEELASRLLPIVTKVADWLAGKIPAATAIIQAKITELGPTFDKIAGYADDIGAAFMRFVDAARPVFEAIAGFVAKNPAPVFGALAVVVGGALLAATVAWGTALFAALSPIYLVVAAVALVAGGLIYAYQHFDGFRNVVDGVASFLTGTALPALKAFASLVAEAFGKLVGWVQEHWGQIKGYIEGAIRTVATVVGGVIDGLKVAWQTWGDELVTIAQTMWGYIKGTVENGIKLVKGVIDVVMGLIRGDWSKAWDGIKGILGAVWDQIKLAVSTGVELVKTVLSAAWDAIKGVARIAWDGFKKVISDAIDGAVEFAKKLPGRIIAAIGDLNQKLYQAGRDLIAGLVRGITDSIPSVSGVLGTITNMIPDWKGPPSKDATLLKPAGHLIIKGLVDGINAGVPVLKSTLSSISSMIATAASENVAAFWRAQSMINSATPGSQANADGTYSQWWVGTKYEDSEYAKWIAALENFFSGGTAGPTPSSGPRPSDGAKAIPAMARSAASTYVTIQMNGPVLDGRELGRLAAEGLNEYGASQNAPIIATGLVGAAR